MIAMVKATIVGSHCKSGFMFTDGMKKYVGGVFRFEDKGNDTYRLGASGYLFGKEWLTEMTDIRQARERGSISGDWHDYAVIGVGYTKVCIMVGDLCRKRVLASDLEFKTPETEPIPTLMSGKFAVLPIPVGTTTDGISFVDGMDKNIGKVYDFTLVKCSNIFYRKVGEPNSELYHRDWLEPISVPFFRATVLSNNEPVSGVCFCDAMSRFVGKEYDFIELPKILSELPFLVIAGQKKGFIFSMKWLRFAKGEPEPIPNHEKKRKWELTVDKWEQVVLALENENKEAVMAALEKNCAYCDKYTVMSPSICDCPLSKSYTKVGFDNVAACRCLGLDSLYSRLVDAIGRRCFITARDFAKEILFAIKQNPISDSGKCLGGPSHLTEVKYYTSFGMRVGFCGDPSEGAIFLVNRNGTPILKISDGGNDTFKYEILSNSQST